MRLKPLLFSSLLFSSLTTNNWQLIPQRNSFSSSIHLGQRQPRLVLILALLVGITGRTNPIRLEKHQLGNPLIGVNLRRQRRRVADFQRDLPPPFRLDRSHIDDDAAAGVGALADTDG